MNNDGAVYLLHPTTRATVVCVPTNVTEEKLKAIADKYWYASLYHPSIDIPRRNGFT
jgi:hypothetical protein